MGVIKMKQETGIYEGVKYDISRKATDILMEHGLSDFRFDGSHEDYLNVKDRLDLLQSVEASKLLVGDGIKYRLEENGGKTLVVRERHEQWKPEGHNARENTITYLRTSGMDQEVAEKTANVWNGYATEFCNGVNTEGFLGRLTPKIVLNAYRFGTKNTPNNPTPTGVSYAIRAIQQGQGKPLQKENEEMSTLESALDDGTTGITERSIGLRNNHVSEVMMKDLVEKLN